MSLNLLKYKDLYVIKCYRNKLKQKIVWNFLSLFINSIRISMWNYTIAASSLAAISIWSISVITESCNWVESFSISSGFDPSDVRNAPDVTWNSSWPTWKFFYSFPSRLLENPAAPVEEEKEPQEEEADVGVGDIFTQADGVDAAVKDGAAIVNKI